MFTLTLQRYGYLPDHTPGILMLNDRNDIDWATMEPPWRHNETDRSCVPEGTYEIVLVDSPKHGHVWELIGVPGRTDIQIHVLNFASETQGCIGVGLTHEIFDGQPAIKSSTAALEQLMLLMAEETEVQIVIMAYAPDRINKLAW